MELNSGLVGRMHDRILVHFISSLNAVIIDQIKENDAYSLQNAKWSWTAV